MAEKKKKVQMPSTQKYLDISEIKYDTVVMKDGSLRAVINVDSINFALKSEEEQNAVIASYVGFLNNLKTPMQIVIQSRDLNINSYLEYLQEKEKGQTNRLLKIQTGEYIEYIKELVSIGKIMSKSFFVVVSYDPKGDKRRGYFSLLSEALKPTLIFKIKEAKFLQYKQMLSRRVDSVLSSLSSMGVNGRVLKTQELIELYYRSYNPETAKNQALTDINDLQIKL